MQGRSLRTCRYTVTVLCRNTRPLGHSAVAGGASGLGHIVASSLPSCVPAPPPPPHPPPTPPCDHFAGSPRDAHHVPLQRRAMLGLASGRVFDNDCAAASFGGHAVQRGLQSRSGGRPPKSAGAGASGPGLSLVLRQMDCSGTAGSAPLPRPRAQAPFPVRNG